VLFTGTASLIIISLCDLVLLIRLWAIYQRRKPILIFLLATFAVTSTLTLVFGVRWLSDLSMATMSLCACLLRSIYEELSNVTTAPLPYAGCFFASPVLNHHWEIYPFTIVRLSHFPVIFQHTDISLLGVQQYEINFNLLSHLLTPRCRHPPRHDRL
jgi:hypothetical protein